MSVESLRLRELAIAIERLEIIEDHIVRMENGGGLESGELCIGWLTGSGIHGHRELCNAVADIVRRDWQDILKDVTFQLKADVETARRELAKERSS